jgi:ankyrin repeat protein
MIDSETIKAFVIAGHGNLEKVKSMLEAEPGLLEVKHPWSETDFESALGAASHVGNTQIAMYLLEQGAKLEITTAAMLGDLVAIRNILDADSSLIETNGAHGISLLTHGVISGDPAFVDFLITSGATSGASMALNIAIEVGNIDIIKMLLERTKPDLTWKNMKGKTALEIAREYNQNDIVALLER